MREKADTLDRTVAFLAKRDGIDKVCIERLVVENAHISEQWLTC
jgi:hypothetical protein